MKPFKIHFTGEQMSDLHRRIDNARWPDPWTDDNWAHGTDATTLRIVINHWRHKHDWAWREQELNNWPQYIAHIDGVDVHFFHSEAIAPGATTILLAHGWPDGFLRYTKLLPLLTQYNVVIPSLPGFAFSTLPPRGFSDNCETAHLWHKLMSEVLGYDRYIVSGGDMGRGVAHFLGTEYPQEVMGVHLTDVGIVRELLTASDQSLDEDELDYKRRATQWLHDEGAYINLHSTKPQTLAYALTDSPIGLAAWLTEKYHAWSDWGQLSLDDLCDMLTVYWMTNSAATSTRMYHGNSHTMPPMKPLHVPVAMSVFHHDVLPAPRQWIERHYNLVKYTLHPHGGHFTAMEQPQAFASDIINFIKYLHEKG